MVAPSSTRNVTIPCDGHMWTIQQCWGGHVTVCPISNAWALIAGGLINHHGRPLAHKNTLLSVTKVGKGTYILLLSS